MNEIGQMSVIYVLAMILDKDPQDEIPRNLAVLE